MEERAVQIGVQRDDPVAAGVRTGQQPGAPGTFIEGPALDEVVHAMGIIMRCRIASAAIVAAIALVLVACGPNTGVATTAAPSPTATQPAATEPASGSTPAGMVTVTRADNGNTLRLHPGDRFLLQLGEDYDWNVTIDDQAVVSRVVGITVVRGAQGVYEARSTGTTMLTAVGDPPCRKAQPPCAIPSIRFAVTLVVS